MKKQIFSLFFAFLLISFIFINFTSAFLGSFPQNSCVPIRTISNVTPLYLGTMTYPNGTMVMATQPFNNFFTNHNLSFCNTSQIGTYVYDWLPCENNQCVNSFEIRQGGFFEFSKTSTLEIILLTLLLILAFTCIFFGMFTFSGILFILLGGALLFNKVSLPISIIIFVIGFLIILADRRRR